MTSRTFSLAALLLVACGGATDSVRPEAPAVVPAPGCYLGASDPTVLPRDARRQADEAARSRVATAVLGSRIREASVESASLGARLEVTIEQTRGSMRGVAVVGWWRDREGVGPSGACAEEEGCTPDTLWAVACVLGREAEAVGVLPAAFSRELPAWLVPPHARGGELCAVGVSGSTVRPEDAGRQAEEDARRRLAMLLCAEVDDVHVDRGARAWRFADQRPSEGALEAAARAEVRDAWVDEAGAGPLGESGVAYARVCLEPRVVGCGGR